MGPNVSIATTQNSWYFSCLIFAARSATILLQCWCRLSETGLIIIIVNEIYASSMRVLLVQLFLIGADFGLVSVNQNEFE